MKHFNNQFIALVVLLPMAMPLYASKTYHCWTNDDGVTECGNYIPPQYTQKGAKKYNEQGDNVGEIERAPTPEEIAEWERKKEEELQRQEQLKQDRALLSLFSTARDIELARAAELDIIDGQIQSTETILEGLKGNLEDLEESYERSQNNPSVTKSQLNAIERNIGSVTKRIQFNEETWNKKIKERVDVNKKFDLYLERFKDIERRGGVPKEETSQ